MSIIKLDYEDVNYNNIANVIQINYNNIINIVMEDWNV